MLSVVTASLNAARFIDRAIASAARQQAEIQHVIVDGGSSDATQAICARYPQIEFVAEPGSSIYQAWNIGIARARGDMVMLLNADDELAADAVASINRASRNRPNAAIVAGRAIVLDDDEPQTSEVMLLAAPNGVLDPAQLATGVPAINAMVFRRWVFERYGNFESRYGVSGDRAFLLRLALKVPDIEIANTDSVLYRYHVHEGSLTLRRSLDQRIRIARGNVAVARRLLDENPPASIALWLRHMRQREAAVAALRCLAARDPIKALEFLLAFFR